MQHRLDSPAVGHRPKDRERAELSHPIAQAQGYSLFMVEGHERFEELALQHVLGGLSSSHAAIFRAHLVECRDCRLRVAELRDMAAELAATEREERRRSAVATQVAREEGTSEEPRSWLPWSSPRWAMLAIVLASMIVVVLLFWNYHLRRVTTQYGLELEYQEVVFEVLASGEPLPVQTREGVRGIAAIRDGNLAVDLLRLPTLSEAQVAVWLVPSEGEAELAPLPGNPQLPFVVQLPRNGQLPFVVPVGDTDSVLVTLEPGGHEPPIPGERVLASIPVQPR